MATRITTPELVQNFYRHEHIEETILNALRAAGKDVDPIRLEDLSQLDQLHSGGRDATIHLADRAKLTAGMNVLDIGGGIGGPARILAADYGCRVTVLDLSESFCRAGAALTERVGLSDSVTFKHGNGLEIPIDAASFDVVWTQHSTMNIPNKPQLVAEIHRVLRPAGRYTFHEVMAGSNQPIHLPVPWAEEESINEIVTSDDFRQFLEATGFRELEWVDISEPTVVNMEKMRAAMQPGETSPVGPHLLLGPRFGLMISNVTRNLREDRLRLVQGVVERS